MEPTELFKLAEGIVILASLMALAYSVFKSKSTESTVREQSELIKIQGDALSELRTQRSEDSRRIKELESSLNVLQTIPLQKIAEKLEIITANDTANASTYTFSAQNLGTASSDRYIICTIGSRIGSADLNLNSVTIGGVSATIVIQETNFTTNSGLAAIAIAAVPTGTTGDVVVTLDGTAARCLISLYSATDLSSATAHEALANTGVNPTIALDVPTDGFAIAIATQWTATTTAWTGLTERLDTTSESNTTYSIADDAFVSGATDQTITADFTTNGQNPVMVAASWGFGADVNTSNFFGMF